MKCSLCISNYLEEISILSHSIVFLYFFSFYYFSLFPLFHWSLRRAFLSLLAILWISAFNWVYLSFSPLPLASLLFSAVYHASSDNHFAFLHFFFLGDGLDSCFLYNVTNLHPWFIRHSVFNSITLGMRFSTYGFWGGHKHSIYSMWSEVKSLSRIRLFATPWTVAYQALPSRGFSKQEYWSGFL